MKNKNTEKSPLLDLDEGAISLSKDELRKILVHTSMSLDLELFLLKSRTGLSFLTLQQLVKIYPDDEELLRLVKATNRLKKVQRDFSDIMPKRGDMND